MKKLLIISLALLLSFSAYSQTSGFGIGAIVGSSVDFSMKYWTSENTAIAAAAGFHFWSYGGFHANADFLFHLWEWDVAQDMMKVYLGPGLGFGVYTGYVDNFSMSVRAPGGVGYYFHGFPLEAFAEIVPTLGLFGPWNGTDPYLAYYVGARWYF